MQLRRLRAITAVSAYQSDIQLYFVANNRKIYARRLSKSGWSEAAQLAQGILTHPLSNVASSYRFGRSVDVFFIDTDSLLHVASWKMTEKSWPARQHQALLPKQSPGKLSFVLPGTAIATVSSSPQQQVVFVVGRDLCLYMAAFTQGGKPEWTALTAVTGVSIDDYRKDLTTFQRLFAHTRLAAFSQNARSIKVAAISDKGNPVLYKLMIVGGTWVADGPCIKYIVAGDLEGWEINPFGDLALGTKHGELSLYGAGISPGRSGLLGKNLEKMGKWEILPGGER